MENNGRVLVEKERYFVINFIIEQERCLLI